MYPVRLGEVTGHFGKKLVAGDAYVDGKAKGVPDFVLDFFCNAKWKWKFRSLQVLVETVAS